MRERQMFALRLYLDDPEDIAALQFMAKHAHRRQAGNILRTALLFFMNHSQATMTPVMIPAAMPSVSSIPASQSVRTAQGDQSVVAKAKAAFFK